MPLNVHLVAPVCALIAFLITLAGMPPYIKVLRERKVKQFLREEGPASHAKKAGTPTAGGALFAVVFLVVVLVGWFGFSSVTKGDLSADIHRQVQASFPVVMVSILCGLLGFIDDAAKIRHKSNAGISARARLAAEAVFGFLLALMILVVPAHEVYPGLCAATYDFLLHCWPLFIFLSMFLMLATTNAVNLHDGMDGLAGGTSLMALGTLAFMLAASGQPVLAMIAATACGAIGAFMIFNKNPAQIFMGDTGSLFIGGLMGALVAAGGMVLYFIPLSIIYILEAVSVMAQVSYFKATKEWQPEEPMSAFRLLLHKLTHRLPGEGKRLFRMTPIHHHFEAVFAEKGASESDVVVGFWVVQFMLCTIVLAAWYTMH